MRIEQHYCHATKLGVTHCLAQCSICDWDAAIGDGKTRKEVKTSAKAHVRQTGHIVTVEENNVIRYAPS